MRRWRKRGLLILLLLVAVLGVVLAAQEKPVRAEIATVSREPLRQTLTVEGTTRVKDRRVLVAPVAGNLELIALKVGDAVSAGKPIARITPLSPALHDVRTRDELGARIVAARAEEAETAAAVERASVAMAHAERELERARSLAATHAISPARLEEAEHAARLAGTELRSTELRLASAKANTATRRASVVPGRTDGAGAVEIKAPFEGRILRVSAPDPGPVTPGTRLLEMGDLRTLEIVADVLTTDALAVRPGMQAEIGPVGSQGALKGRVRLVEPSAFTKVSSLGIEEQRANVVIDLMEVPAESGLGEAFRVEVKLVIWTAPAVLCVPNTSVFRQGDSWYVMAVKDGRALRRVVGIGHRGDRCIEVLSGLEEGAWVVRYPDNRIVEGSPIEAERGG